MIFVKKEVEEEEEVVVRSSPRAVFVDNDYPHAEKQSGLVCYTLSIKHHNQHLDRQTLLGTINWEKKV